MSCEVVKIGREINGFSKKMKKIVGGKTILRSLMGLPVRANEQLQDLEFRNWNRTHKDWREVPSRNTEPADSVKNLVGITLGW